MNPKKRGLGVGLAKMLSQNNNISSNSPHEQLRQLPLDLIQRGPYQPRLEFDQDALQDLANSIQSQGVIQPIVVRQLTTQQYEIIAGERRWRAAQLAGLSNIPVIIKNISDENVLAIALIENLQRENLNALEEARALHRLLKEFGLTHEQVATSVGKSRSMVSNLLRLLELDEQVKTFLEHGDIEMGHARALLILPPHLQRQAAKQIIEHGLSVRAAEALIKKLQSEPPGKTITASKIDPNLAKLQQELSDHLGTKVAIQHSKNGKGKIMIAYPNLDILDGILKKIHHQVE